MDLICLACLTFQKFLDRQLGHFKLSNFFKELYK